MKVRISYQHVTGHSGYDREWVGDGPTFEAAKTAAEAQARRERPGLKVPEKMFWENRLPQGDGIVVVLYDF